MSALGTGTHLRPRYIATVPSNFASTRPCFDYSRSSSSYGKRMGAGCGKTVSRRCNSGGSILPAATTAYTTPFSSVGIQNASRIGDGRPRSASVDRPIGKRSYFGGASIGRADAFQSLSGYRSNRYPLVKPNGNASERSSRASSLLSVASNLSSSTDWSPEVDYKLLYENEKVENEKLTDRLKRLEELANETIANNQLHEQVDFVDGADAISGNAPTVESERQLLEGRIAELENISLTAEQLRMDNQRLKEENGALIRVISKLSR